MNRDENAWFDCVDRNDSKGKCTEMIWTHVKRLLNFEVRGKKGVQRGHERESYTSCKARLKQEDAFNHIGWRKRVWTFKKWKDSGHLPPY